MSQSRSRSAEAYLSRHLGSASEHSDLHSQLVVQESLWDASNIVVSEKDSVTSVKVTRGDKQITYDYQPVIFDAQDFFSGTMEIIKEEPWAFRELRSAEIINTKNGYRLDILEKLPPEWRAFVSFGNTNEDFCNILDKVVVTTSRFANKFHYITLAHEIGHAVDYTAHPHLYELEYRRRAVSHASHLEAERNAHAFALFHMRRFLSVDAVDQYNVDEFRANLNLAIQTHVDNIIDDRERETHKRASIGAIGRTALGSENLGN